MNVSLRFFLLLLAGAGGLAFSVLRGDESGVYLDRNAPLEQRVDDLVGRLTPDEKISLLSGKSDYGTMPIPRLGIPSMIMSDAGAGVRGIEASTQGPATNFTCGVMMAATWDPDLLGQVAYAIGEEARNKGTGTQVLLGPAVNIQRSPLGGRNGEYLSEDPFLAARMAVGYVQGLQKSGIAACVKHFACNNEEADRNVVDVRVSERALREIYFPAFEASVQQGHAWTVMSSYNRVNGRHSTANHYLLTDVLKAGWGFDGAVISDWGAVHQVASVIHAGNDIQMPGDGPITHDHVLAALNSGQITQAEIDDSVKRIVRTMIRTGLLDGPWKTDHAMVNSQAHRDVARKIAEAGIVLLKNEGDVLPLDPKKIHSIALIGPAVQDMQLGAQGSPEVTPVYAVGLQAGISHRLGNQALVTSVAAGLSPIPSSALVPAQGQEAHGFYAEYFSNPNLQGTPAATRVDPTLSFDFLHNRASSPPNIGPNNFSVRWTARLTAPVSGRYTLVFSADDGCRLYLDGKLVIDHWIDSAAEPQTAAVDLEQGRTYDLRAEYYQRGGESVAKLAWNLPLAYEYQDAIEAAKKADAAIVFVSTNRSEAEGHDRPSMQLPLDQDAVIQAVAKNNPHTIVILNNGTPVDMRAWLDRVPGVIESWFPGEEGGTALAEILFGDVNPSGKLPTTFGQKREDYPDYGNFPGVKNRVDYAEGIYVGYRHFDKDNITPAFPFGYGLSYTRFEYGPLRLSRSSLAADGSVQVRVPVKNVGAREGREVVELYVHDPAPRVDRPVRELKGFSKVGLAPGETKTVALTLKPRDFAYFDTPGKQWKADAGDYEVQVGASSRDIRQTATVHLDATYTEAVPLSQDRLESDGGLDHARAGDLAMNRPVQASSAAQGHAAVNAVDDDDRTAWQSDAGDPQWLMVDLGANRTVDRVRLFWADAYALAYSIQVSDDGQNWKDVYSTTQGEGDVEGIRFPPVVTRWLRVHATKAATPAGYALFSLEAYGPPESSAQ